MPVVLMECRSLDISAARRTWHWPSDRSRFQDEIYKYSHLSHWQSLLSSVASSGVLLLTGQIERCMYELLSNDAQTTDGCCYDTRPSKATCVLTSVSRTRP